MNTADDMMNPGPDFRTGYGKINARKAYRCIEHGRFFKDSVMHNMFNAHFLVVPPNVKQMKVMVYWTDYEATAGISSRTLINDLDITLQDPNLQTWQPWVLNPTPDSLLLESWAVRTRDSLNNVEQITLNEPAAGGYVLRVSGTTVPLGPQSYFVVQEYLYDEVTVTYPVGGEEFVPGNISRIRWDSDGDTTDTFTISYSMDGGINWITEASGLSNDTRWYDWQIPMGFSDDALVRVERGSISSISGSFDILDRVQNPMLIWNCGDSCLLHWDDMPQADGFIVYQLGANYMDSIGYTTDHQWKFTGLSPNTTDYFAVSAVKGLARSKRTLAIERDSMTFSCVAEDVSALQMINPSDWVLPDCATLSSTEVKVAIRNLGLNSLVDIPLAYRLNGGIIQLDTLYGSISSGQQVVFTFDTLLPLTMGDHLLGGLDSIWFRYEHVK